MPRTIVGRKLAAARAAFSRGDMKRAAVDAWAAAAEAAGLEDEATLQGLAELARTLVDQTAARERTEAERLLTYVQHALKDAREGTRRKNALEQLLQLRRSS